MVVAAVELITLARALVVLAVAGRVAQMAAMVLLAQPTEVAVAVAVVALVDRRVLVALVL